MNDKNFYIMLADPPWAGPNSQIISGPDIRVYNGVFLSNVQEPYKITLTVDKQAANTNDFPPCDIHGPNRSLMFSKAFIDLLASLGVDNIQYSDADVTYEPTGQELPISGGIVETSDISLEVFQTIALHVRSYNPDIKTKRRSKVENLIRQGRVFAPLFTTLPYHLDSLNECPRAASYSGG